MPSLRSKAVVTFRFKGGPGSGHRGHAGRPGKRGGSLPGIGGGAFDPRSASKSEMEKRGYVAVYRGTGPKGMESIRPSSTGQLGPGVYFYDSPMQAKVYAQRGGGIVTGFVHESDVKVEDISGSAFTIPHKVVVLQDVEKFVRRGDISTSDTVFSSWKKDEVARFESIVNNALEEIGDVVEKERTSAIVAFSLENDDHIRNLSEKYGPNRVQPLHMTLLYVGHAVDSIVRDDISERLRAFSNVHAPVDGVYNGWASFDDTGDGYPHVLLYDSPQLPFFRQRLAEAMDGIRPEQDHGFTPHTTLSYLNYQDKPNGVVDYFKTFGSVWLFWGDEKHEFPLIGDVVEKQLPIGEEGKQALINLRIELFFDESDTLAERMYTGEISLGQWQEEMKSLIRNAHTSAAAIGKGGWDEMTWQDWGRLGTPMREQYRYLQGFTEVISEKRDVISLKAIQARARLYGESAGGSAVLMQAGADIESLLPWLPRDGQSECLNRCHCVWSLDIIDRLPDGRKVVQAVWTLGVAEHCDTCRGRDGHAEVVTVSVDTDVPRVIGGI